MAYNGLEDSQNWPFSVRYTASPYRKSKWTEIVDESSPGHWSNPSALTNGRNSIGNGHQQNVPYPLQYMNTGVGDTPSPQQQRNSSNNHFHHHHYREFLPQQQDGLGVAVNETGQHSITDHYGLPDTSISAPSASNCHFFMRYPHSCQSNAQLNQVEGILDEGYIEDLKQPYNNHRQSIVKNCSKSGVIRGGGENGNNVGAEYDPYSYVYDSKIHEDMSVTSVERDSSVSMPIQYSTSSWVASNSRNGSSENEYEEIRDVSRYMNRNSDSVCGRGRPYHFQNFSSTEDILAEVVQVQQRHDRVLDQLNLEVENLLISSTNDVEDPREVCHLNENKMLGLDKMSSISLNGIYQECCCDEIPSAPQFGTLNSDVRQGGQESSLLFFKESSCCFGSGSTRQNGRQILSRRSNSLTLNSSSSNPQGIRTTNDSYTSASNSTCVSSHPNNCTGIIISRKKKLDHQPKQLSGSNNCSSPTKFMNPQTVHHIPHPSPTMSAQRHLDNRHCKNRHHRSYSLIPHWRIREHFRRLLRQQHHKLKKTEGSGVTDSASTIPISSSGQDFVTNKMSNVSASSKPTGCNKAIRSSSMDELGPTTVTEEHSQEHWYSADSDTEPDSLTALPESASQLMNNCKNPDSFLDSVMTNSIGIRNENGSRLDIGSAAIPDVTVPKAPKFRRGTGLKDKWRESWSTKTLSKPNMDEENKLLRWFSLRKNQSSIEPPGSRHSTLPLLSEEDLKRISYIDDEDGYWPRRQVQPPTLPAPPAELTPEQLTRRHIIAAIVHSENSYVAALQRLVNEYKKQLECSHPAILSSNKISTIFHRVPEILQCHSLFRIALAECVRRWDHDEKIGDVFVASFSKSLVLDVYSEFINNFGLAMETAKGEARRKSAFADFLKVKQMTAHDRLSLFGLMVKPVQRFPQFILLLQDLLKHTPKDSSDRMSLQLALTQLESLAAMLNERKRESEQYQAFRETIKSIGGKFVLLRNVADDPNRILLRQDIVTQLEFDNVGGAVAKNKSRKLLLLNDMLICVALSQSGVMVSADQKSSSSRLEKVPLEQSKSNGMSKTEKTVFKFSYPVNEVEVEDISISPTMSRFVHHGGNKNGSLKSSTSGTFTAGVAESLAQSKSLPEEVTSDSITLLEEMHDYEVLSRVLSLVSSLHSQYEGLTEESVKELMLEIQHQIRRRDLEISYFDSSCLTLLLGSGNNRDKVVFQMQSPSARNEWIEELRMAQLARDPHNSPSWDIPSESPYPHHKLPLFVRSLSLTKSPHIITVKCGCFFTHTFVSPTGRSKIVDYLWVSSTDGMSSHVTAFRSQQNTLKEVSSFDFVEEKINDLLFVSGHVWLATQSRKIMLYDPNLANAEKGSVYSYILSASVLKLTLFEGYIYAGLADGTLAVFSQNLKVLKPQHLIPIGQEKIPTVFGSREHVYVACGNSVVSVDIKSHTIELSRQIGKDKNSGPISHMVCSGVGLWITTQDSGTVCLYHLESLQHLQDVSIAPSVFRIVRDSFRRQKGCYVTCLTAHKGWLWIGTNLGVILTIPLPRLEGVPIISSGKANVSFHGYYGPVTFLMPLTKTPIAQLPTGTTFTRHKTEIIPSGSTTNDSSVELEKTVNSKIEEIHPDDNNSRSESTSLSFNESVNSNCLKESYSTNSSSAGSSIANCSITSAELKDENLSTNSLTRTLSDTGSVGESMSTTSKTLVLRKKNSRDNVFMRNCKTLPRSGQLPSNLRFSIDSDVYGLYGNLINVIGLEDEGRFVDPLYDALRRSDPELIALDAKISTFDRRLKMRMSRPRSLDLSNWSVDSKISASSDESVGFRNSPAVEPTIPDANNFLSVPVSSDTAKPSNAATNTTMTIKSCSLGKNTTKKSMLRQKMKNKAQIERTVVVVVGGRGYLRHQPQDPYNNFENSDSKVCTHLTVWQMKT